MLLDTTAAQQMLVAALLHQRLPHANAVAFGSRVSGWPFGNGPKPYSDLDIALWGLRTADGIALAHLRADLEESALPWRVDISDAQALPAPLRAMVEERGFVLLTNAVASLPHQPISDAAPTIAA
jgi:predicted nucleotidyltransferase